MAKSRDPSSPDPPVGIEESDEEQEADGTSEEEMEGSESESDPDPEPPKTQNTQINKKSTQAAVSKKSEPHTPKVQSADSSSDDEESDSETDSDSPAKIPESNVKPIASKPMNATPKTSRSKSNTAVPSSPVKPTSTTAGAKRPATTSTTRESKKSKIKSEKEVEVSENKGVSNVSNDDPKKLFQRLWSEDDEIVILQGMIDYRAKNKADPVADLNAFLEFIKKSIHIDVSRKQLQHKIRRLKTKYENNLFKEKKGKHRANWKPHEQISYELSQKVWGGESNFLSPKSNGVTVKRSKAKNSSAPGIKVEELEAPVKEDSKLVGYKGLDESKDSFFALGDQNIESWIRENALKVVQGVKREQMLDKWKKFRTKEVELYAEMLELNLENAKLLLEAMKSLGD